MSQNEHLDDVVASNVNEEALVLRGCTMSELLGVIACTAAVVFPVALIIGLFMGRVITMMGFSMIALAALVFVMATVMQRIKRGKPAGYFSHALQLLGKKMGLVNPPFVLHDGEMDIFRKKQCVLVGKHLKQSIQESD